MLKLIPIFLIIFSFGIIWADDDEDYSFNYKIYEDGSFEYNYKLNDKQQDFDPPNAYDICYREGQTDSLMSNGYLEEFSMAAYHSKKLQKECSEGYKEGYN